MSLSPAQVQIIANAEPFQAAMRRFVEVINASAPQIEALAAFLRSLKLAEQRRRARTVTRTKQRRHW